MEAIESDQGTKRRPVEVPLVVVRIYFNRLHSDRCRESFWRRLTRPPTAIWLAREALRAGFVYAIATVGAAGFVRGARTLEVGSLETASERLPSCLELVAPEQEIVRFLDAHRAALEDSLVMKLLGNEVTSQA